VAKCINCGKYTTKEGGECVDCQAGLTPKLYRREPVGTSEEQIQKPSANWVSFMLMATGWLGIVVGALWAVVGIASNGFEPWVGLRGLFSGLLFLAFAAVLNRLSSIEAILQAQLKFQVEQNKARTISEQQGSINGDEGR
jgi:hypothetical protein